MKKSRHAPLSAGAGLGASGSGHQISGQITNPMTGYQVPISSRYVSTSAAAASASNVIRRRSSVSAAAAVASLTAPNAFTLLSGIATSGSMILPTLIVPLRIVDSSVDTSDNMDDHNLVMVSHHAADSTSCHVSAGLSISLRQNLLLNVPFL